MDIATRIDEFDTLGLDEAAALVDGVISSVRRGVVTPLEAIEQICATAGQFLRYAPATVADVELMIDYARDSAAEIAEEVRDPVLLEHFENLILDEGVTDLIQAQLAVLLERLESAAHAGDAHAAGQVEALCRSGVHSHRLLLSRWNASEQILQTAYRLGLADALGAAVSPAQRLEGQIAEPGQRPAAFELALNLLAHLAAQPEGGERARAVLLDLITFIETAGEAAIRLPIHLLDHDNRQRLLGIHEARVALFTSDPVQVPLALELLRDNRVVRSAVWQAFDARHIT